jgi:hypothetical protein
MPRHPCPLPWPTTMPIFIPLCRYVHNLLPNGISALRQPWPDVEQLDGLYCRPSRHRNYYTGATGTRSSMGTRRTSSTPRSSPTARSINITFATPTSPKTHYDTIDRVDSTYEYALTPLHCDDRAARATDSRVDLALSVVTSGRGSESTFNWDLASSTRHGRLSGLVTRQEISPRPRSRSSGLPYHARDWRRRPGPRRRALYRRSTPTALTSARA